MREEVSAIGIINVDMSLSLLTIQCSETQQTGVTFAS